MASLRIAARRRIGPLLLDIHLEVPPGPLLLIGPNGAGKTQTLLMILGIDRPDQGRITLGDTVLFDAEAKADLPPEHRRIAYVPQDYGLFPHLTAVENVAFGVRGARGDAARRTALGFLDRVDASHLASALPGALSGGERQRVALARALATEPRAVLLDEPFSALDVQTRSRMRAFVAEELVRSGVPALVVTHDPRDAVDFAAPVAIIESGRIVQTAPLETLRRTPASPFVDELLNQAAVGPPPPQE